MFFRPCFLVLRVKFPLMILQLELSPPQTPHRSSCWSEAICPSQPTCCMRIEEMRREERKQGERKQVERRGNKERGEFNLDLFFSQSDYLHSTAVCNCTTLRLFCYVILCYNITHYIKLINLLFCWISVCLVSFI